MPLHRAGQGPTVSCVRDDEDFKREVRARREVALRIIAAKQAEVEAYDVILNGPAPAVAAPPARNVERKVQRSGGLPGAVEAALAGEGSDLGFLQIAERIEATRGQINSASLRGVLSRMQQDGRLRSAGRGRYALPVATDAESPAALPAAGLSDDGPIEGGEALWSPRSA